VKLLLKIEGEVVVEEEEKNASANTGEEKVDDEKEKEEVENNGKSINNTDSNNENIDKEKDDDEIMNLLESKAKETNEVKEGKEEVKIENNNSSSSNPAPTKSEKQIKETTTLLVNNKEISNVYITKHSLFILYDEVFLSKNLAIMSCFTDSIFESTSTKNSDKKRIIFNNNNPNEVVQKVDIKDNIIHYNENSKELTLEQGVCLLCKKQIMDNQQNILNCCFHCIEEKFNSEILTRYFTFLNFSHKSFADEDTD